MTTAFAHPEHRVMREVVSGFWEPAIPLHPTGLLGWKIRRRCRKEGGHWWHPIDPMIGWACCQCGAQTDGSPRNGQRR